MPTPVAHRNQRSFGMSGKRHIFNIYSNWDLSAASTTLVISILEDLSHAAQHSKYIRKRQLELTLGPPHSITGFANTLYNVLQFMNKSLAPFPVNLNILCLLHLNGIRF